MISEKNLQHPVLVLMFFALLGIMGLFTLNKVSIALMPDIDMPYLSVSATYTNAGPESVEKSVTKIIEDALVSLNNLKTITSTSREGQSQVNLEFNYGTDLDIATNDVRDKLDRIRRRLPDDVTPTIFKMNADSMPILRIAVRGNRSTNDLKQIAEDKITDVIEQAEGVGEAYTYGGKSKIVRVELEQNRLQAYELTLTEIGAGLAKQNIELGGGSIKEGTLDYSIRTTGEYNSIEEINRTVVAVKNGYDVKLSDVGHAFFGYEDASSYVYINGEPGVYVAVTKQSGENSVAVANAVYQKLDELKTILPQDIELEIIRDDTVSIRETISTLIESGGQGLILAIVILFVFLCLNSLVTVINIIIRCCICDQNYLYTYPVKGLFHA